MRLNLMKYYGGKGNLLNFLKLNLPDNIDSLFYIEPFGGAGNLLLNKKPSVHEVWNDIDVNTYMVFEAVKNGSVDFKGVTYCKLTFDLRKDGQLAPIINPAQTEYILRNMSRAGMKKDFAWSERKRGGLPGDVNAWNNKVAQLPLITKRLENVTLLNEDAIVCMRTFNNANAIAYLDPPYVHSRRVSKKVYDHELTIVQHEELLKFLAEEWKGLFLLSGYDNPLYINYAKLSGWHQIEKLVANNAGQTKKKSRRAESLWRNY